MLYRITIDMAFETLDPMNDLLEEAKRRFPDAKTINPGEPNEERGFIITQECFHDETESPDCPVLEAHYTPA